MKAFGSRARLEDYQLSLHQKRVQWPEEFILATGWFKTEAGSKEVDGSGGSMREITAEKLIKAICRVTGATRQRLMQSVRGPGGNPERRFAVWAMRRSTFLTHKQIAELLEMTPEHVARDVRRSRAKIEDFDKWVDRWQELFPAKVSIVRV